MTPFSTLRYGVVYLNASAEQHADRNYAAGKTKMAAWFVSNCVTKSMREVFVKGLQNFIDVRDACR